MKIADTLLIEGNVLKDKAGKVIATISQELGRDGIYAYTHVFAISSELLAFFKDKINPIIGGFIEKDDFSNDQYARLGGHLPYTSSFRNAGFPDWVKKGIAAIALAEGEDEHRSHYRMTTETDLRQLFIEGNILKDDMSQVVAEISTYLTQQSANRYGRVFAASVEFLDIIDFTSSSDLAHIKNEYNSALEFNKLGDLPPNVSAAGVQQPFIPDELAKTRRLVAKAKGNEYRDWT
jgi:hypothetical protein